MLVAIVDLGLLKAFGILKRPMLSSFRSLSSSSGTNRSFSKVRKIVFLCRSEIQSARYYHTSAPYKKMPMATADMNVTQPKRLVLCFDGTAKKFAGDQSDSNGELR